MSMKRLNKYKLIFMRRKERLAKVIKKVVQEMKMRWNMNVHFASPLLHVVSFLCCYMILKEKLVIYFYDYEIFR